MSTTPGTTEPPAPVPPQRPPWTVDVDGGLNRRFAEISGRPEPAAPPGRFNVGRLLRRCAGTNEALLAWVPTERPRYTHMGGFVLFTALMAIGSSTIALSIAFDQPSYVVFPAAVFWGVVIFNLDRWITASALPERGFRRFAVFLPRLLMAVVFAIVIAEPVLLIVFKTAVTEQLGKIRAAEVAAYKSLIEECNPARTDDAPAGTRGAADCKDVILSQSNAIQTAQSSKAEAQKAADQAKDQLATANEQLATATSQMTSECRGQDGSDYGDGPVCKRLSDVYRTALANAGRVAADHTAKQNELTQAVKALATVEGAADAGRAAEINRMIAEYERSRDGKGGLLERIEALNSVAVEHLSLLLAIWAVRLLLIAVDSIPAIAKISSGTTTYDRLAREEALLGQRKYKARSSAEEDETLHWVDEFAEHAELGRAERRTERDRAAEALLLSAARHRDQQAPQFRRVVGDDQAPFVRATYAVAPRVAPAGPAYRPPAVEAGMKQGPAGRARRGKREDDATAPGPSGRTRGSLQSISVVALGGPGSGKTTFLAQMYAELKRSGGKDQPFTLTLSDEGQRTQLESWADTVREAGSEWPDSTTTTHLMRYEFTCGVEEDGAQQPVLKIDYWDYSGEALLRNTVLPGIERLRQDLSEQVAAADALLVIVDGQELHKAWDGDPDASRLLVGTLEKIQAYAEAADCPVQIVVTKWDELENRRHPRGGVWNRAKVVQALSTLPPFQAMQRGRTYRAGTFYGKDGMRVIPVSVVGGAGSTKLGGEVPIRRYKAAPVNIDVPFAGLLPDRLDQIYADKGTPAIERQLRLARSRVRWAMARTTLNVAGWVLGALPLPGLSSVLAKLGELALTTWLPSYLIDKLELSPERTKEHRQLLKRAEELRASASRADRARYRMMEAFSRRLIRFDDEYPPTDRTL